MVIVPSGKTRVMVAQNFSTSPSLSEGLGETTIANEEGGPRFFDETKSPIESTPGLDSTLNTEDAVNDNIERDPINDDVSMEQEDESQFKSEENKKTLTSYLFEKLQSYGYPGRRLQEFKSEFVKESVSPEGIKDIEVIIPDKKYPNERGFTDTIENEELKNIAHEVNKSFGLNFNGADRAGGKWTIKFTSANIVNPDEDSISHDTLDQVYGKPNKSGQPDKKNTVESKPTIRAFSIREMIKDKKNDTIKKLQEINGE